MTTIPFNKPYMTGKELGYIAQAYANGYLASDGRLTAHAAEAGWSNTPTDNDDFSLVKGVR